MTADDGDFPARLFPASFTLLYCPVGGCGHEMPFLDPQALVGHVESAHGLQIRSPTAVLPFLDRYLAARVAAAAIVVGEEEDERIRSTLQQERLAEILVQQEQERSSQHRRGRHCLFCPHRSETT